MVNILSATLLLLLPVSGIWDLVFQHSSGTQELVYKRESTSENDALRKIGPQYAPTAKDARAQVEIKDDKKANKDASTLSQEPKTNIAEDLFKQGNLLFDGGKVEEAIQKYNEALSINPDHASINYNLGMAYLRIKRLDDAAASCSLSLSLRRRELQRDGQGEHDRLVLDSLFCVGMAETQLGKYDDAIGSFRKFTEIEKRAPDAWNMLGNLLDKKGDNEAAIVALKESIAIKPTPPALFFLGRSYSKLKRWKESIDHYKQCITLEDGPHVPPAHFALGVAYLNIGDKESAMAEYSALKKIDKEGAERLLNLINK
jgi:tetratricopeptide (TPR) repeat protein